ncbi:MAG: MFS transporter [Chloroflexi bacterium]|nr:MFS transporter [Chloroflexota bacterium]
MASTPKTLPSPVDPAKEAPREKSGSDSDSDSGSWFHRTFESLASPQYRLLWFGLLMTMAALNMQMLARGFLSWELTKSPIMVGLTGAGFAPPILLLSLFGGAIADRVDKKRIIMAGQLGMGLLSLFIAVSIVSGAITIWHLIGSSVVQGTLFAFLMPARQAIIPQLVEKRQLSNAVALNASGMSLMTLSAPAIAGYIYSAGGPEAAYFTIAGLNIGAVLLTSFLKPAGQIGAAKAKRMWRDVKEGLRYARADRTVLMLLIVALSTTVLAMPMRTLLPVQIEEVFNRDVESLGLLLSMIGVGALAGSLLIAGLTTSQHRGMILLVTTAVSGLAILLAGLNTSYFVALAIMVLVGVGDSGRRTLNASLIMEQTDSDHRGRVMGIYMMNFGMIPLGTLPLAALGDVIGIRWAFALAGALLIAAALLMTVATTRIRRL